MVCGARKDYDMKTIQKFAVCVSVCCLVAAAFGAKLSKSVPKGWGEDFTAASATAQKEGKLILLAFSGSDWCGWCVKMEKDIYSDKKFINEAKKNYVLLMIDSPRNKEILSKLALKQNPGLLRKYGVRGFPCTVIVRPTGEEVKRFSGYQSRGVEAFLKDLKTVADEAASASAKAAEAEKAAPAAKK